MCCSGLPSIIILKRHTFGLHVLCLNQTAAGGNASPHVAHPTACKSAKIPDRPMLTDVKEPHFEDWLLLMTQKLEANHDHFDSLQVHHAYVASQCDGKARKHITPCLHSKALSPYNDSSALSVKGC